MWGFKTPLHLLSFVHGRARESLRCGCLVLTRTTPWKVTPILRGSSETAQGIAKVCGRRCCNLFSMCTQAQSTTRALPMYLYGTHMFSAHLPPPCHIHRPTYRPIHSSIFLSVVALPFAMYFFRKLVCCIYYCNNIHVVVYSCVCL